MSPENARKMVCGETDLASPSIIRRDDSSFAMEKEMASPAEPDRRRNTSSISVELLERVKSSKFMLFQQ